MGASKSVVPINIDNYLTIEALEDGMTVSLSVNACEYCIDGSGDWVALPAATPTPAVNTGQTLSFKATRLTPTFADGIGTFSISKKCNLKGNCMSMIYGNSAQGKTTISNNSQFSFLFRNCVNIIEVSRGFLPATTLGNSCYSYMFYGCTSMTIAPELPAMNLAGSCYYYMYYGCTSLVTPSELPATTLQSFCYCSMYQDCTSLVNAPELPARILVSSCYLTMFRGCTSLSYIKAMFISIANYSIDAWVGEVSATGTFVKNAAATWDVTGISGIPSGWTVEEVEV